MSMIVIIGCISLFLPFGNMALNKLLLSSFTLFLLSNLSGSTHLSHTFHVDSTSLLFIVLLQVVYLFLTSVSISGNSWLIVCTAYPLIELFFIVKSFLSLFILFEASVIPFMFLIPLNGSSPERISSLFYLLFYTLFSSVPLFIISMHMEKEGFDLIINTPLASFSQPNMTLMALSLISFLVKIPFYTLHAWLPRAHVEAPLEGSILLAGLMLKLGFYGLVRMIYAFPPLPPSVDRVIICISLLGSAFCLISSLSSDDLNKSVAFSSISHMNLAVCALFSHIEESVKVTSITIFSHGLIAPLLFWLVTILYTYSHSRSVLVSKGVFSSFPGLQLLSFILLSINISPPLLLPFLGELGSISVILERVGLISLIPLLGVIFLCSCFCMFNYSIQSHSPCNLCFNTNLLFNQFTFSHLVIWTLASLVCLFFSSSMLFPT